MAMQVEKIIWRDAHDIDVAEWVSVDLEEVECLITTVGLLAHETDLFVVVTHSLDPDGQARGLFAIPKSAIVDRMSVGGDADGSV